MAKGRAISPVVVTPEERETLERWARRPTTAQGLAMRARVVLGSAEGQSINAIARDLDICWITAKRWRSRFQRRRLDGLVDEPRPGAPRQLTDAEVERVLTQTLDEYCENWRTAEVGPLTQELASLVYFTGRANADRLRALQRVYVGLYVLVTLTGGLVALAFRFVVPSL